VLVIILVGIVAVLYACCCMSSKIDRLAESEDIDAELEKLKKEKLYEDN
jgi:hypothetical protein